jgi:hypothetical protein
MDVMCTNFGYSAAIPSLVRNLKTDQQVKDFLIEYGDGVIDQCGREVDRLEEAIENTFPGIGVNIIMSDSL